MRRRQLLQFVAATPLAAGCAAPEADLRGLRVVVAGAGIVGAAIAYFATLAGARVTVIDRAAPASHASRGTFAWINATWAKQPRHYHALNQRGVERWSELAASLSIPIRWGGSIEWFADPARQARLARQIAEQQAWGEPACMIGADELSALEPNLDPGSADAFALSPRDGAVDPVAATHALLAAATERGAKVRYPLEALGVVSSGNRLRGVQTTQGVIDADRLVLATGADPLAPRRCADLEIPQRSTPGVIALTEPLPPTLNTIVVAPGVHLHQRGDGRVVLGEQDGAPDTAAHAARLSRRPNDFPSEALARQHGERMLAVAQRFIPTLRAATIESAVIGWRPLPLDGQPVLGATAERPNVHFALMHSGVTLAPVAGELIAANLAAPIDLRAYAPNRDFRDGGRY
ncbi:MAG: FAD-binding oxidoreductase [Pseudomonadota bacterium]